MVVGGRVGGGVGDTTVGGPVGGLVGGRVGGGVGDTTVGGPVGGLVGGRVGGGVVVGTHPVCPALTMDPSGHVEQEKEIKPEYVPGGHFLHP
jgi:hypothetical protein